MHWTGKPATNATAGALLETGWAFTDARGHRIRLPEPIEAQPPPGTDQTAEPPPSAEADRPAGRTRRDPIRLIRMPRPPDHLTRQSHLTA
ncbi:hypothetical protein [Promicromonospora sp. NPDC023805]|uniref:hypothetical protein n=1 Tax=Promicromonospora sp. NPDC023805 TaxID=3154696 RepID=UPI0033D95681